MIPDAQAGELISEMAQRMQPDRIILFGSYARGTVTADSDGDLLVVVPVKPQTPVISNFIERVEMRPKSRHFAETLIRS
jgi:predicted nucleotidyltransferase